jgi:hypothetical protein
MREFPDTFPPYLRDNAAFPYLHGYIIPKVAETHHRWRYIWRMDGLMVA